MTHYTHTPHLVERRWLSSFVGSLVVATVILTTLHLEDRATAAECSVNETSLAIKGPPSWDAIGLPIQTLTTTLTRNCFCASTPYLSNRTFVLGKTDNPGITTFTACLSPNTWRTAPFNHATDTAIGKVNLKLQPQRALALSYSNKKEVLVVRTTPPEFKHSTYSRPAPTIMGPVQEFPYAPPSDERSMTETILSAPVIDKPSALFGAHSWGPLNQFQGLQRLTNGESHRMNMTTALALHSRDCVNDCP